MASLDEIDGNLQSVGLFDEVDLVELWIDMRERDRIYPSNVGELVSQAIDRVVDVVERIGR